MCPSPLPPPPRPMPPASLLRPFPATPTPCCAGLFLPQELEAHRADLAKSLTAVLAHDAEVVAVARDAVAQMEAVKAAAAAKDKVG